MSLSLVHLGGAKVPRSGVEYPLVMRDDDLPSLRAVTGIMLALVGYALIVPLVAQGVIRIGYLFRGGEFDVYRSAARGYEYPEGLLASHLALATLIPIALLLARYINGYQPRWVASVQPGLRGRYLLISALVALVVLNAVLWLGLIVRDEVPAFHSGQDGWGWFLLAIVVGAPLQAAAEEVFFRGYLLQALGAASGNKWVALVASSLLFALFHGVQNPALFAHRLAFGLVAGGLVLAVGGLEAGIAAHVVNNLGAYGYAMFTGSIADLRVVSEITWEKAGWDIAGFALFAGAAWWVGRRLRVATATP
ncbi:CPBP family intramembrane glutamic endopeptidase [Tessaracoccus caeni]|uniref:CPBP family intramembrane glutamic endopeptidase n=1 Tax=Tessaracoccus caeni TaxID=3031239 RepID=UPI0023DBF775|nr:type II CAAX endopeptidase family protein [Tessaracoccus caeni]MDF1487990.1 type II CAAX endopeptidase family protein [Tessaracoccus caeni]